MLKLTRNPKQVIIIGDNEIRIKVVKVNARGVKLEIEAPREIPIHKAEWVRSKLKTYPDDADLYDLTERN